MISSDDLILVGLNMNIFMKSLELLVFVDKVQS